MKALRGLKKAGISPQKGTEKAAPTWAAPRHHGWKVSGALPGTEKSSQNCSSQQAAKTGAPEAKKGLFYSTFGSLQGLSFCYRKSHSSRDPTLQSIPAAAGLKKVHSLKKKKKIEPDLQKKRCQLYF